MAEYDRRSTRRDRQRREPGQIASGNRTSSHQGEAIYTGFSNRPLDVQSRRDDRILARILDDDFEDDEHEDTQTVEFARATDQQELTPEDERQINQVFQAGIPTAIVGTYGTTLGTKVIWQSFAKVIVQRFGAVAAQALGLSAADGLLPVGEAIAFGLLAVTAWQIYRNWDELWRDAEQILVGQEPEPQIYTTPNSEPGTIEHTGSTPPEVETGTPPIDVGQQVETPNNTGDRTREQPNAEDYMMESQVDQDFNNPEVRRRDNIAHDGYYTRKNLRKLVQEGKISTHDNKHLKARTEEQAKKLSHDQAQYLPGINNGALEKEALLNGEHLLRRSGAAFWNFYRSNDYVGYDQGVKTRWIRAEYSSGVIHGHPMNPKRISKYVKNPTP